MLPEKKYINPVSANCRPKKRARGHQICESVLRGGIGNRVCVAPQGQKRQGHINWTCSSLRAAATRAAWDLEMNRTSVPTFTKDADLATEDGLALQALFEGGGKTGVDMPLGGAMWFTVDSVNAGSKNHRNQRKPACWVDKILRCSSRQSLRPRSGAQK